MGREREPSFLPLKSKPGDGYAVLELRFSDRVTKCSDEGVLYGVDFWSTMLVTVFFSLV